MTDVILARYEGASPALEIARDLAKRGVYIAPIAIVLGAVGWGAAGAASVAYGLGLVVLNFVLAALLIGYGARISAAVMGAAAMFGFLIRLALIFAAVMLVKDAGWVELVPLGLTIIVTHLGLLFWEMKFISASLAYPGLKPRRAPSNSSPAGGR
jgi:hypothetical protein